MQCKNHSQTISSNVCFRRRLCKSVPLKNMPTIWLSKCHFAVTPDAVFLFENTRSENHSFPRLVGLILQMQMLWHCKLLQEEESKSESLNIVLIYTKRCKRLNATSVLYYSIAVQGVLFDFGFEKLFNKRLAFPPLYRYFYVLILAASRDYCVPRILFVL